MDLAIMARLRLGITRLLLLDAPRLVLIDDADRFLTAVPRLPGDSCSAGMRACRGDANCCFPDFSLLFELRAVRSPHPLALLQRWWGG